MVVAPWSNFVPLALVVAETCCLTRLFYLKIASTYPALGLFLIAQIVLTAASSLIGLKSDQYEIFYVASLLPEWIVYGLVMREIYGLIFRDFPGIAVLGRWSVYGSIAATLAVGAVSFAAARKLVAGLNTFLPMIETSAHCFTFGFALLILIILVVLSRYPINLSKNLLINAVLFGAVLLGEAAGLIADQLTIRNYTARVNLAINLNTILCFSLWPFFLTSERQVSVGRLRSGIDPKDETRLLAQLRSISEIVMRLVRKKN